MDEHSHRRDVWGDDPEEVDASETVAELEVVQPEAARRWHEHPAFVPVKAVARFIQRSGKRIAVTIAGFAANSTARRSRLPCGQYFARS